jgi:hypothetical protein
LSLLIISFTHNWLKGVKSSLRFISNLFFSYWAKNRFASFLTFFFVLLENTKFTKNTKNLPRIPRTHMKSLHYWFLVSCVIKGVKSSLRFISNLFLSYWAKNRFAPFLTFFGLIGEYQVYQEYQEFTKNTRNTHEIASLFPIFSILTLCRLYLFSSMKIQVLLHFHIFST